MSDPGEGPRERGEGPRPGPSKPEFSSLRRRRKGTRRKGPLIGILVLLLVGGGLAWYWFQLRPDPAAPPPPAVEPERPVNDLEEPDPELDLPPLDASDALIRDLVSRLSAHPQLARWLATDDLVERFVVTVVTLAGGGSPVSHLEFLEPEGDFQVRASQDRLYIAPSSYRRYDLMAQTFASLDTRGTAQLYRQLHPLFEEAYADLGIPDVTFDEMMNRALGNLLAVQVPDDPIEVVEEEAVYEFRDPVLEDFSAAEKHLLRMGPQNARQVQSKLRELAQAIPLDP